MIFSLIILVLFFVVVYFHYLQGFFSATLSAILAILAALAAVSYHEILAERFIADRFPAQSYAITLMVLFAAGYGILRVIFDKLVPGNVIVPHIVDKAGAAAMGAVAATFSTGVLAIAAQTLPFGPSIAGYTRYETTGERRGVLPTTGQSLDVQIFNELTQPHLDPAEHQGLLLPVDDMVIGLTSYMSHGGSMSGERPMPSVHPNYLDELFASRLGIEPGAKITALDKDVSVRSLHTQDLLAQVDHEYEKIRGTTLVESPSLMPPDGQMFLIARVGVDTNTGDKSDGFFRFSPGSIRLVTRDMDQPTRLRWKNYHPIGTLHEKKLYRNRVDDFLFAKTSSAQVDIDLVFLVNTQDLFPNGIPEEGQPKVADGVTLVVKRMAREDLSGMPVKRSLPDEDSTAVLRKRVINKP